MSRSQKYNEIEFLIEDFIEQTHQFRMIGERRTDNMRDIVKTLINHSKIKSIY